MTYYCEIAGHKQGIHRVEADSGLAAAVAFARHLYRGKVINPDGLTVAVSNGLNYEQFHIQVDLSPKFGASPVSERVLACNP